MPVNAAKINTTVTMRMGSKTKARQAAGAIANTVREGCAVEINAIGAGAVNQFIKAHAIANKFLEPDGVLLVAVPSFDDLEVDGGERTAISTLLVPLPRAAMTQAMARMTATICKPETTHSRSLVGS